MPAATVISDIAFASDGVLYGSSPRGSGDLYSIDPDTGAQTFLFSTGLRLAGLTAIVPEPSTVLLLTTGLIGLAVRGRHRKA